MPEDNRRSPGAPPDGFAKTPLGFSRIAVVGLGLIGASVAMAVRRARLNASVVGVDVPDVLRQAVERGIVDAASERLEIVSGADLVILAAPIQQNIRLLPRIARHVLPSAIVTDVGSTKRAIVEAARPLAGALMFVGGHPIAGAASDGIENARADLFAGRRWLFTPDEGTPGNAMDRLFAFVKAIGAEPDALAPSEHDHVMAFVSHLPQLAASALMRVAGDGAGEAGLSHAGPGLMDTTRLAESPFGIWADICVTNEDEIRAALDRFIGALINLRTRLTEPDALADLFSQARAWRERLRAETGTAPDSP